MVQNSALHRVVVYYQSQFNDGNYISPTPLKSLATHLVVGAIHINDDTTITLNGDAPESGCYKYLWKDISSMQSSGIAVMCMLGGWGDGSFQHLTDDFDKYYLPLRRFILAYSLDGVDLDVETSSEKIADIELLIRTLRQDFGTDFIITLTPVAGALLDGSSSSNLSGFSYSDLESACGDDINWYNVQFYSGSGSMATTTDYTNIVTGFPLDPSRLVAITLTNSDNGSGWVELDTVKSTMRQLLQTYGDSFGGIAGWEYFNSQPDPTEPWSWAALMKVAMVNWKEVLYAESFV